MAPETYDKLQDLLKDINETNGSNYNSWEQDFLDTLEGFNEEDILSDSQDSKIEELWQTHIRRNDE